MISRTDRFTRLVSRPAFAVAAILTSLSVAPVATAQEPPAAIDQYRPSPPGAPDGRPGDPGGGGNGGGGGVPDGSAGGVPGSGAVIAPPAGGGGAESVQPGDGSGAAGPNSQGGEGSGRDSSESEASSGPSLGGYPVTDGIVVGLIAAALTILLSLAIRAWRRYRDGVPLSRPG